MQALFVILLFVLAAGYLGWRAYAALTRRDAGCGKGCGCAADKPDPKVLRARG